MNTVLALRNEWKKYPTDLTIRAVLIDGLLEFGTEDDWNAHLDDNRSDHEVREKYGEWLVDRGNNRGLGYIALGKLCRVPTMKTNMEFVFEFNLDSIWIAYTNNPPTGMYVPQPLHVLPEAWIGWMVSSFGDGWSRADSRRELEDRASRAWSKLSPHFQHEFFLQSESIKRNLGFL